MKSITENIAITKKMNLKKYHMFHKEDAYYIYLVDDLALYKINKELFTDLNVINSSKLFHDNIQSDLYTAISCLNLINAEYPDNKNKYHEQCSITNISLNVAQLCNLNCIYCYGDQGEYGEKGLMSEDTAYKVVNWMIDNSCGKKELSICFFGGEPLLNFPLIKKVVDYARSKGKCAGKNFQFAITTNGTILNDEIIDYLVTNNFSITFSFDGDKDIQDYNRPFKNGKGSFDIILPQLLKLIKRKKGQLLCRATVTKKTDIKKAKNYLESLGFKRVFATLVTVNTKKQDTIGDYKIGEVEINDFVNEEENDIMNFKNNIKQRTGVLNKNPRVYDKFVLITKRRKKMYGCGVGRNTTAISISGDIYPCHRFVGVTKFKMGNINNYNPEIHNIYLANTVSDRKVCSECWVKYLCGGGCIQDNFSITNDLFTPNQQVCSETKKVYECLLDVYAQLDRADIEYALMKSNIGSIYN